MLTRLLNAVLYILVLALVIELIIWALGFIGVPAFVTQILIAIGVILAVIVLIGVLTGRVRGHRRSVWLCQMATM